MRLTTDEINSILTACKSVADNRSFLLYLFGSRTNINMRGGDIDLLCKVSEADLSSFQMQKNLFLAEIKSKIGEQKIDFIIASPRMIEQDEFLKSIISSCVLLNPIL